MSNVILKGVGGLYHVATPEGVLRCKARGRLRKQKVTPKVGDLVDLTMTAPGEGAIDAILPRKNALIRPPVANVDMIVVVVAAASPEPDLFLVDKLLVTAAQHQMDAALVVNKADLTDRPDLAHIYQKAGYPVLFTCAQSGQGLDGLRALIEGKTAALAGNSGVGKSSLINRLLGSHYMETGGVSKIERGRHTTRHAELLPLGSGYVVDTPGFSLLSLRDVTAPQLAGLFPEFGPYLDKCAFADCGHDGAKASVCAVRQAVEEGAIASSRYQSYCALYQALKEIKEWELHD